MKVTLDLKGIHQRCPVKVSKIWGHFYIIDKKGGYTTK